MHNCESNFFIEMTNLTHEDNKVEEQEINLTEFVLKLWERRKLFYKSLGGAIVIGFIMILSIPKEYTVTVTLAAESTRRTSSSLASAASMLGLSDLTGSSDRDALNILLFPDILASNPFALELYNMPVKPANSEQSIPLSKYLDTIKQPWWRIVMGLPVKAISGIGSLFSTKENEKGLGTDTLNLFRLSQQEAGKLGAIKQTMQAKVDKKTGITTVTVTMQDADVAATVADSVIVKLQDYVTTYRTKKAAVDCAYWEKLYKMKQEEYYKAQQKYAIYLDENKSLFTQQSKIEGARLQNEMNLAYQVYNQTATQLQMAQGKLQESKPVFAVLEPASVPLRPSAPRKMMILVGCLFVAFIGTTGWILFGEELWKEFRKGMKTKSITTD